MEFQEADLETTQQALGGRDRAKKGEHIVRFFLEPIQDPVRTLAEGRPIYQDKEFIEIRIPGDNTTVLTREVSDRDRKFFAEPYRLWKEKGEDAVDGTPLKAWPMLSRSQVEELKHFNIRSVENLAEMSDTHCQGHMGFRKLREQAKLFLAAANDLAPMTALQEAVDQKDNQIDTLTKTIEKLQARIAKLEGD